MEIDPFSRNTPESSSEDKTDDESSSKKKKKSKRLPLFNAGEDKDKETGVAETSKDKESESPAEPLWRRILGQPEEDKASTTEHDEASEGEESSEGQFETGEEQSEDAELESLSDDERLAVAQAYIDARQAELIEEQSDAAESGDEAVVAERAADISLLENMRRFLQREHAPQEPLDAPVNQAYDATVEQLGFVPTHGPEIAAEQTADTPEALPLPSVVTLRAGQSPETQSPLSVSSTRTGARTETFASQQESYQNDYDTKRKTGSALLVGGLVGYAVGRRRGRIKTEKRLKVVEQKLTKQVETVQQQLVQKEQQIRSLARENYAAKTLSEAHSTKREAAPKIEKKPLAPTELLGLVTLKAVEAPRTARVSETLRTVSGAETRPAQAANAATPEKAKPVAALSRSELLTAAAEVTVGATNLRRVFETNLISEQGLRRLIEMHENGGNIRESLEREIVEKEMSYERDPRLRNRTAMGSLAAGKVVRADIDKPAPASIVPTVNPPLTTNNSSAASSGHRTHAQSQKTAAAAVVTLLVVIAVLLVILFSSR